MFSTLDLSVIAPSLPFLWTGLQYSLKLTLVAMTGGIILGTFLALCRLSSSRVLAGAATAYVDLMRSTSGFSC